MLVVMVPAAIVIFSSVWVVGGCLAFWTTDGGEFSNAFTYGGNFLTQYPIDILGVWLRRFLAYIVPLAFVCYFPALYVLDKPDPLGLPGIVEFLSPSRRARSAPRSPASPGSSPCATTGAPADRSRSSELSKRLRPSRRGRFRRERHVVDAVDEISFRGRARRAGRLPRPERRRQVDHDQDADRHPRSDRRAACGRRPRSVAPPRRAGAARSVSCSASASQLWWDLPLQRLVRAAAPHLPVPARHATRTNLADFGELLDLGSVPAHAGAPALARPAHARRADRRAAARARAPVPRRADDRARRRRARSASASSSSRSTASAASRVLLTTHDLGDIERLCRACWSSTTAS